MINGGIAACDPREAQTDLRTIDKIQCLNTFSRTNTWSQREAQLSSTGFGVSDVYNRLYDVSEADAILERHGKANVTSSLCTLIRTFGFQTQLGVRLLHKHNTISKDEFMLEQNGYIDNIGACLVTQPISLPTRQVASVFANTWQIVNSRLIPLEFSEDKRASLAPAITRKFLAFTDAFAELVTDCGLANILGPCITTRTYFGQRPHEDWIIVETNDPRRRANIVRFADPATYAEKQLIVTSWIANYTRADSETVCKTHCEPGSCISFSACVKDGEGNHEQRDTHSKGDHAHQHIESRL